jgi:hypothetical protein
MKDMKKRVLSMLMAMLLMVSVLPLKQEAEASRTYTTSQLQDRYRHGTFFTVNGRACADSVFHQPGRNCGSFELNRGFVQCAGFAYQLGWLATGTNPETWRTSRNGRVSDIKVGDILYYNFHYVYVTAVSRNSVTLGEANFNHACIIVWGRTMVLDSSNNTIGGHRFTIHHAPDVCRSHDFRSWTTTSAATCTRSGSRTRSCRNCNHTETETIPALGHRWGTSRVVTPPTHQANGSASRSCTRSSCNRTETTPIRRLIHAYDPGDVNGDGSITVQDALQILRFLVGLPSPVLDTTWR